MALSVGRDEPLINKFMCRYYLCGRNLIFIETSLALILCRSPIGLQGACIAGGSSPASQAIA